MNRWAEAALVKDCTTTTTTNFLFKNVVIRSGCPKIWMGDQGANFVNQLIEELTEEFHIEHKKITPYHPQVNGVIEAFNKILENA